MAPLHSIRMESAMKTGRAIEFGREYRGNIAFTRKERNSVERRIQ